MPSFSSRRRAAAIVPTALLAVIVAACGATASPSGAPASPGASAPASVDPGVAIDTDALLAAAPAKDGQVVRVKGFFLAMDGKAVLCSVVLESYPPQCGGATVGITGPVPAAVLSQLERTNEPNLAQAQWGQVIVVGTFHASDGSSQPTIEISEIEIAAQVEG